MTNAGTRVGRAVMQWDGVTAHPHRFGGVSYRFGRVELGHVHGDLFVDVPLPRNLRDEVVREGTAEPHHALPDSGWVTVSLDEAEHEERAVSLLRRAYELALAQRARRDQAKRARRVSGLPYGITDA
jgi:predicted DNA-binding protein (MmcQ/YjbR family)